MEYIAGFLGVLLLLWLCSGSSKKDSPRYRIEETGDKRYCEVVRNDTGSVEFVGTKSQCEKWIEDRG